MVNSSFIYHSIVNYFLHCQVERQEHEMDERVEQQGSQIVELKQKRAALNEKKTAAANGMSQCRSELKKISSDLRETEEASEKLEENR